jgi:nicotinamidase-related amidase
LIHTEILMNTLTTKLVLAVTLLTLASAAGAALPDPGMEIVAGRTALLITDPQNDFLSPDGVTWGVVGESVKANNTVANIDALFKAAKANDIPVFVSPHYYYPTDHGWKFEGALETLMHAIGMFDRKGALTTEGFEGSGADWLEQYKKYIDDGATVVSNPHKVYGPETNDMVLQLRKRGIDKVILGGMSANLCTESHMRELLVWYPTRPPLRLSKKATATKPPWSTSGLSPTPCGRPKKPYKK